MAIDLEEGSIFLVREQVCPYIHLVFAIFRCACFKSRASENETFNLIQRSAHIQTRYISAYNISRCVESMREI